MQHQFEEGQVFEAEIVDHNKGGLIVNADGVRGFVPLSQVAGVRLDGSTEEEIHAKLATMVGQRIFVKVLEINRRRNRLILSERQAVQERRGLRKEQLINELHEGEVRHGRVSSLCDFGAFVEILPGQDGMVHISQLDSERVEKVEDVVGMGDEITVMVTDIDPMGKIRLSRQPLEGANAFEGRVEDLTYIGKDTDYHVRIGRSTRLRVRLQNQAAGGAEVARAGDTVWVQWSPPSARLLET